MERSGRHDRSVLVEFGEYARNAKQREAVVDDQHLLAGTQIGVTLAKAPRPPSNVAGHLGQRSINLGVFIEIQLSINDCSQHVTTGRTLHCRSGVQGCHLFLGQVDVQNATRDRTRGGLSILENAPVLGRCGSLKPKAPFLSDLAFRRGQAHLVPGGAPPLLPRVHRSRSGPWLEPLSEGEGRCGVNDQPDPL